MRFNSNRSYIRHYLHYLLNKKVDVGERIFLNRSNPLFLNELPAVCVSFEGETEISVIVGSSHCPKQYERALKSVTVYDIINEESNNIIIAHELNFELLYHTRAYTEKVMDDFEIVGLDIYISPESEK